MRGVERTIIHQFDRLFPDYLPGDRFQSVDVWWQKTTGELPQESPGLTIGVSIRNEAGSLSDLFFQNILAARIPAKVPCTVIAVTNGSTDDSPKLFEKIIWQVAEVYGSSANINREKELCWPPEELGEQYKKQDWYATNSESEVERLPVTILELPKDNLTIKHVNTSRASKNNALNIIRYLSRSRIIISVDADSTYHPYAFGELYGALARQGPNPKKPVAAGLAFPVYSKKTPWSYFISIRHRPRQPKDVDNNFWGGLFAFNKEEIPPFPVDLMYEDFWLRQYCWRNYGGWMGVPTALGFFPAPSTLSDEMKTITRSLIHHVQVYQLHREDLPLDYIPELQQRFSLTEYLAHMGNDSLLERIFHIGGYLKHKIARRQAESKAEKITDWSALRTFEPIRSTKR